MTRFTIACVALIAWVMAGCGPVIVSATLVPNVPTEVFLGTENVEVYNFESLPSSATTLRLAANPPTLSYSAEVRDAVGNLKAVLSGGGGLEDSQVTVPAGSGAYEVRITTDSADAGTVELTITGEEPPSPTEATNARVPQQIARTPQMAGVCQVIARFEDGINLRERPSGAANIMATLPQSIALTAEARTSADNEMWYRVRSADMVGWVASSFVSVQGTCQDLPVISVPISAQTVAQGGTGGFTNRSIVQPAVYDTDTYDLRINLDTGIVFEEQISYPEGDQIDRLWLTVDEADVVRQFTLRMTCDGVGTEGLRWGTPDNPVMGCEGTVTTTFSPQITRRNIIVTLPDGSAPGSVRYRMSITPAAPEDADAFLFPLYKDGGGRVSEAVSYPAGDTTDVYVMRIEDFAPEVMAESERTFTVYMVCNGANVASVRWGEPASPRFLCDQPVSMRFDVSQPQRTIAVTLPEGSANGYLSYSLFAIPVAPVDSAAYLFTVDRNAGGQFGESISSPQGDTTDVIQFAVSNLTGTAPHNFREFQITLLCSGAGVEFVRWRADGDANRQCGEVITVPMMYEAAPQTLTVSVPEGSAYVNYTVLAQPVLR